MSWRIFYLWYSSHARAFNFYYLQLNVSSLSSQQGLNFGCRTELSRDLSALLTTYHEQTTERMGKPRPCLPLLSVTASSLFSLLTWAILLADKQEAHPIHLPTESAWIHSTKIQTHYPWKVTVPPEPAGKFKRIAIMVALPELKCYPQKIAYFK